MTIFKRSGEPVALPASAAEHQVTLSERKNAAGVKVAELQKRIEDSTAEQREALLEGRFEVADEATGQLEFAKEELVRAQAAHAGLVAVELEVAAQRQFDDLHRQLAEAEQSQALWADRCAGLTAELPVLTAALQQLAREALAVEEQLMGARFSVHVLKSQIAHFGEPSVPLSRFPVSGGPVTALFEAHPEYRSLANGVWFIGVPGPR